MKSQSSEKACNVLVFIILETVKGGTYEEDNLLDAAYNLPSCPSWGYSVPLPLRGGWTSCPTSSEQDTTDQQEIRFQEVPPVLAPPLVLPHLLLWVQFCLQKRGVLRYQIY